MSRRSVDAIRLPFEANIDLTYRCTNRCRHCWLWTADTADERASELTTGDWREVIDQARALGTRRWSISGGEPMLREDFPEILDYVTRKAVGYTLNTNGSLITPEIARLLTRKGTKMIAVYGATEEVFDRVTRTPGSFAATMEGFARLKEAGAGFIVQLIPMRENWHEWQAMQELAQSLGPHWRTGAAWLFMTACGDPRRNAEIARQRLDPADVIALDEPIPFDSEARLAASEGWQEHPQPDVGDDRVYAECLALRRDLHVDPYGRVAHCSFVKDPALRFGLRKADAQGSSGGVAPSGGRALGADARTSRFADLSIPPGALEGVWDRELPAVADACRGGVEYLDGCGSCDLREDCRWCDVYGYLEHRRHGARVAYLCEAAREARRFKDEWRHLHRRTWQLGGMTIQVDSDRPIHEDTFAPKFRDFEADPVDGGPRKGGEEGADGHPIVRLRHHFGLPELSGKNLGEEVYRRPPWSIRRLGSSWLYLGVPAVREGEGDDDRLLVDIHRVATVSDDHTRARIYNGTTRTDMWEKGNLAAVTMFPTDQILLARVLADRQGLFLHSGAVVLDGAGLCFVGHSEAGKSTTMSMLRERLGDRVEVLCDDRNIVRYWGSGPPPVPSRVAAGDSDDDGRDSMAEGGAGTAGASAGFWVHGTWSHGSVPMVSASQAALRALIFPEKGDARNELVEITNRGSLSARLAACTIRPLVTADWWEKTLDVIERLVSTVPAYEMRFDKSGDVVPHIERLVQIDRVDRGNG